MLLDAPASFQRPDGVWEHHLRQSDISRFRKCPELHRRHSLGMLPEWENDTAMVGTACHAGAAAALQMLIVQVMPDFHQCLELVQTTLKEAWHSGKLRQMLFRSLNEAHIAAEECFRAWWGHFLDAIDPDTIKAIEWQFDVLAIKEPLRHIYLSGTMDLLFNDLSVCDWKFPGDRYTGSNAWKHERYDVQPIHYLWAAQVKYGSNPLLAPDLHQPLPEFTYGVVVRGKQIAEELDIIRTVGDVQFYRTELLSLAKMIELRLPRWPLNPTDWHCSDKWCPAWDQCRGMYLKTDPFGLMAKVADATGQHIPKAIQLDTTEGSTDGVD
jgi:hypothetical protein